jgi:hypothetical protein
MALQQREDTIHDTAPVAPWRRNQGRFEFLDRHHDYPDPLAAAQDEARVLAQDNAHLVRVIATMQAAQAHNDTVFLPRIERALARKNARIARAELVAWACVGLVGLVVLGALALWAVAMQGA